MMNNLTDSVSALKEFNYSHTKAYIPVTVLLTIVIFVGFVSNVFAFLFYTFRAAKSAFQFIICILSLNDALTNIALVHDVVELCYFVDYRSVAVCKLFYCLKHWLVGNSLLLIVAVALDRHRLVCHPFAMQITIRIAKYIVLGLILFSLSISVHYFATSNIEIFNISTANETSAVAYHCSLSQEASLAKVIEAFHITDICIHALCVGSLVVFYSLVIRKLVHSRHRLKAHNNIIFKKGKTAEDSHDQTDHSVTSVGIHLDNDTIESNVHSIEESCPTQVTHTDKDMLAAGRVKNSGSKKIQHKRKSSVSHITEPEVKLTIMAFVITVASVVSFVPYYVSMMLGEANMDGTSLLFTAGEIMARRFYILNSAVNPFIMMYFNANFRQYIFNALFYVCSKMRSFKHDLNII